MGAPLSPCSPGGGSSRPSPAAGPPLADPRGPRSRKASATGAPPPGADLHFFRFSLFGLLPCPGLSFHPKRGPGRETLSKQACPQTRLPLGSGFPRAPRVWPLRRADPPPPNPATRPAFLRSRPFLPLHATAAPRGSWLLAFSPESLRLFSKDRSSPPPRGPVSGPLCPLPSFFSILWAQEDKMFTCTFVCLL